MGQIEDLRLFVAVIESGGIARAAEELNIAKSAVSRRLAQLEDRYGVRLIDRQPRLWEVTTAGQELYQRAVQMVADAEELDADFLHTANVLKGPLTLSVAREFGLAFLKPVLLDFARDHPEIDLTVDFDDRKVDLDRENYDLAIRITYADLTGLIDIPLGESSHALYASPDYAVRTALPERLEDLPHHSLLYYGTARRARWSFFEDGKPRSVEFQPALSSNNGPFLLQAALDGHGIARLPDFVVGDAAASGQLIQVLPHAEIAPWGIHLAYSAKKRLNKRMRAMIAALQAHCAVLRT